jgi:hypothetical protein
MSAKGTRRPRFFRLVGFEQAAVALVLGVEEER